MIARTEEIARAFGLRRAGREYVGKCPSCGYAGGFAVTERDGRVLLYCAAGGCSQADLWAALAKAGFAARGAEAPGPRYRRRTVSPVKVNSPSGESLPLPGLPLSAEESARRDMALAQWRRTLSATARFGPQSIVACYLASRGITGEIPAVLRLLPDAPHPSGQRAPAMVALVEHVSRGPVATHRTFLRGDGSGKADLEPVKLTLGPCGGGAVRLSPASAILAVAEGIETALSYMEATGTPTWAALSTGGMRGLILPEIVREIVIAADGDIPGIRAAQAAARRWLAEGRQVRIARPPIRHDFNDLIRGGS